MIFGWLKKRRRRKILAQPFPEEWTVILHRNLPFYSDLSADERSTLRDMLRIFIAEKSWEGCGGLEMNDEIRVTIAAQACLLLLGLDGVEFDTPKTILVYPAEFFDRQREAWEDGFVVDNSGGRLGEAWYRGPVVLSWADARRGGRNPYDGVNVVFHEFAHQLDMQDGVVNGTPPLESRAAERRWQEVMTIEYDRLVARSRRGRATLLDHYGAQDPGEFFAVSTECFFERSSAFELRHRELYDVLRDYYGQDPAERIRRAAREKRRSDREDRNG